ncbi:AAA family ATPase [Hahella ganghwensis]|uniref:AAA family ATPase n=1 Tax=Hahella ganghwensis TaxID=286420 RepID=UPI000370FE4C|nr:AAA family ATPase [Hahella ganghwensis]
MSPQVPDYPFSAVAGQAPFKRALILAAVNPRIGGVLISGPRGCAKSTLARGLADVLPDQPAFVTLPLGATEEMVTGTMNLQQVLHEREVMFNPGILAKAHKGVLYVDEVNLLADPLVDLLLDVAASGVNRVERDGISHSHASDFLLVGTMNPDEGELRPQLSDRFGLMVELDSQYNLEERIEIVRRREAFDQNPADFCESYHREQKTLRENILRAREHLGKVHCSDELRVEIARRCEAACVDGLRADIVWYRAAVANAAWRQNDFVSLEDIDAVESLVLAHRRRSRQPPRPPENPRPPFSRPPTSINQNESIAAEPNTADSDTEQVEAEAGQWGAMPPQSQEMDNEKAGDFLSTSAPTSSQSTGYNRSHLSIKSPNARRLAGTRAGTGNAKRQKKSLPDWFRTLLTNGANWPPEKISFKKGRSGCPVLHLVLLDASASTLRNSHFGKAKGIVSRIAEQAYLERHQLQIIGFGNEQVQNLLARQMRSPKDIRHLMNSLEAGGGTPVRDVLLKAHAYLKKLSKQEPDIQLFTYLLTDGLTRQTITDIALPGECTVIDIEQSRVKRGRAAALAEQLGAVYLTLTGINNAAGTGPA